MTRWGVRIIVFAAATLVVGWVISHAWVILFPVAMALIVSTVLIPPATWLRDHGWPSALAAITVVLGFVSILVGGITALAPSVAGKSGGHRLWRLLHHWRRHQRADQPGTRPDADVFLRQGRPQVHPLGQDSGRSPSRRSRGRSSHPLLGDPRRLYPDPRPGEPDRRGNYRRRTADSRRSHCGPTGSLHLLRRVHPDHRAVRPRRTRRARHPRHERPQRRPHR